MKARICLFLMCCILLGSTLFSIQAQDAPALSLAQSDTVEPGNDAVLTLSLPQISLAGGFLTLQYDASLFLLTRIDLLQGADTLTLTYDDDCGEVNILLDAAQNVQIDGAFLSLTFATSEEAQPGSYTVRCTVPSEASFYAVADDGSTVPLAVGGCQGTLTLTSPPLPTCPARYLACQETNPKDGKISVRLCALVDADTTLSRGDYGFMIAVTDADGTRELTLAGSELTDHIDGGGKVYTAQELGGRVYTAALSVLSQGKVTLTVTPYVRAGDMTLYAGSYTISYQDGAYLGTTGCK